MSHVVQARVYAEDMTTTQNTTTMTNSFGFPIEVCSRCKGSGEYSNDGHHSRCYKCNGARTVVKPKAKVAWLAFVANVKSIQQPLTQNLVLNTKVRQYNDKHGEVKEVVSVEITDEVLSRGYIGKVENFSYACVVTFADGSSVRVSSNTYWVRQTTLEDLNVDFYLAQFNKKASK
jgi:DNA-directed RNA polymerase subunit RPC12/RpoP